MFRFDENSAGLNESVDSADGHNRLYHKHGMIPKYTVNNFLFQLTPFF